MKKKIILYHPSTKHEKFYSFYWIPYSVLTIASMIYKNYDVIILDDNLANNNIKINKELLNNCLCIGISMMTGHQISGGIEFAKRIKKYNKNIPIIAGGTHPTLFPELTISNRNFDFIIQGQGEIPFLRLINYLDFNNEILNEINGLVFIKNKKIVINKNNILMSKEEFPNYPWELIDLNNYINNDPKVGTRTINYVSSQGCPFKCTFCSETSLYKNKWKTYGKNRIIKDISYLMKMTNINAIKFYDANFFVNLKTVDEFIIFMINNKRNIKWAASGHPKTLSNLDDDFWNKLEKSNCKRLLIGAESGSQEVLDSIKKDINVDLILSLANKLKKYNIIGSFTFIVGFPGVDTKDEIFKTLNIAKKIKSINIINDVKIHFFSPYPGTELFDKAIKYGFKSPKTLIDWANYDYYNIETPWIDKKYEQIIHNFNKDNCEYVHL